MIDTTDLRIEELIEYVIVNGKNQVVKDRFYSKEEAETWMEEVYGVEKEKVIESKESESEKKMEDKKISILGTEWKIVYRKISEDKILEDADGYSSTSTNTIVIRSENVENIGNIGNFEEYQKGTLRHELIHAFLQESGLAQNSIEEAGAWARNEEMVDWFAIQSPKIYKVFQELGLI